MKTLTETFKRAAKFENMFQSADWKEEKHVPVIEAPEKVNKGETFKVTLTIGKEVGHPNTTEHHIRWVGLYFLPEGEKFPCEIGRLDFASHGESVQGPNTSTVYTHHQGDFYLKTSKPGTLLASSYCNIHGLWENSQNLEVR